VKTEIHQDAQALALLSEASLVLVGNQSLNQQFEAVLAAIGDRTRISRTGIYLDTPDGLRTRKAYEWCNIGIEPLASSQQDLAYSEIPFWKTMLAGQGRILAKSIRDLPGDLYHYLAPQGIYSLLAFPLYQQGGACGFMSFEECGGPRTWNSTELDVLRTLSSMVSATLERHAIQARKDSKLHRLVALFHKSPAPMAIYELPGSRFVDVNDAFQEKTGYTRADLQGHTPGELGLLAAEDLSASGGWERRLASPESEFYESEYRLRTRQGNWIWMLERGNVIERNAQGSPERMFSVYTDITRHKDLEEQASSTSVYDGLTHAFNRRYLYDQIQNTLSEFQRTGSHFALALFGIDHFEDVNERFGQAGGDQLLVGFVRILGSQVRNYDLVARYGDDRFAVLFRNMDGQGAATKANSILQTIRQATLFHGHDKITLTCSAGVVGSDTVKMLPINLENLVSEAEQRLAQAKADGRDRVKSRQ